METCVDFFSFLEYDTLMMVLMCLEDPSDLVRVSSVSRSWRHFVTANGLCKQLCLRMFPCLHRVDHVTEPDWGMKSSMEVECSKSVEWETLEREHRVYAFLAHACASYFPRECVSDAISASSTDNYPAETIRNTLEPRDRVLSRASYWSSKGHSNPAVPETLTYKLVADICIVTEIGVHPFEAFFQWGTPIYSAKSVRFRMGHQKASVNDSMGEPCDSYSGDNVIWTYTSPEFAMAQENCLQKFKLPEPVLCIGGILQVELMGRVQRQEDDDLFYICVAHVQVTGTPLSPPFSVEILEPSGKFALKAECYTQPNAYFEWCARDLEPIMNLLQGRGVEYDWNEGRESDEEMAA